MDFSLFVYTLLTMIIECVIRKTIRNIQWQVSCVNMQLQMSERASLCVCVWDSGGQNGASRAAYTCFSLGKSHNRHSKEWEKEIKPLPTKSSHMCDTSIHVRTPTERNEILHIVRLMREHIHNMWLKANAAILPELQLLKVFNSFGHINLQFFWCGLLDLVLWLEKKVQWNSSIQNGNSAKWNILNDFSSLSLEFHTHATPNSRTQQLSLSLSYTFPINQFSFHWAILFIHIFFLFFFRFYRTLQTKTHFDTR